MIDRGLLLALVLMALALLVVIRLAPPRTLPSRAVWDEAALAAFVGTLAGRLVALAFDDPAGLLRIRDIPLFRGGVDFWPGAAAAVTVLVIGARRAGVDPAGRLADLLPYALVLYGVYESGCVLRDGCFGPVSPVGLVPHGVGVREFPVSLALAGAVFAVAAVVRHLVVPSVALALGLGSLAWFRFAASFWLPKLGDGVGRAPVESLVVAVGALLAGSLLWAIARRRPPEPVAPTSEVPPRYDTQDVGVLGRCRV